MKDVAAIDAILGQLRVMYPPSRFAVLGEVADSTGYAKAGLCDAIVVSLLPSAAFALHGVEIKLARSDWLRERKHPEKSDRFRRFCTRWFLLTPPGIAAPSELPRGWGLLEWNHTLRVVARAPRLRAAPVPAGLWAALVRRAFHQSSAGLAASPPCRLRPREMYTTRSCSDRCVEPRPARRCTEEVAS